MLTSLTVKNPWCIIFDSTVSLLHTEKQPTVDGKQYFPSLLREYAAGHLRLGM